jgi:hypothetical protein
MRRVLASLTLLLPLIAAGQSVDASRTDPLLAPGIMTPEWVEAAAARQAASQQDALLPLWHASDGRMLSLTAGAGRDQAQPGAGLMDFRAMGVSASASGGLRYDFNPHVQAHVGVAQHSWLGLTGSRGCTWATSADNVSCLDDRLLAPRVFDSEIGATFHSNGYSVGVGLSSSKPAMAPSLLPRVLPDTPVTASGLPLSALDSSTSLQANGRVPLGGQTGIDLGASVGRIRLLPGNLLGISTLGQKSLSLGVDSGSLSGRIVGRVVQPETGNESALGPDKRWTSVDLGVTWRLPWQGSLSFGAQNVWSSGQAPAPKDGPEPDQSRIPYVQYHQDL